MSAASAPSSTTLAPCINTRRTRTSPGGRLTRSERLAAEVLSLPLYPELSEHEAVRVVGATLGACGA